ncbi:MAG: phenylalanine--tRNA ligase subunit alpha [Dehalococcoidia bacterium]|nr:phenylalanine--tRNA ligase subunit alpha [Dehalococcoidia bacterium]
MADDATILLDQALRDLEAAADEPAVEAWRIAVLGRNGSLNALMSRIGAIPTDERRAFGAAANQMKQQMEAAFAERNEALRRASLERETAQAIDVTLPGRPLAIGHYHPTTQIVREISGIFERMGFSVVEGPEVEWDYYNFEALNIPKDHPARDMWDTIWVSPEGPRAEKPMLMRTHTSPMQVRVMEQTEPPIRVIVPGRCYRYEATDATHESMFYQIEGLAVDEGIGLADLKGTLYEFARQMFGEQRKVRFRCDYFPFVEPGVDMSIDCFKCDGKGCRTCKNSGWIEILGAGMVHPEVLRRAGYDPDRYTGFAFGMGPERVAMLRYGIEDIRLFYANDLRFLRQF